jgi:hypothetical protein
MRSSAGIHDGKAVVHGKQIWTAWGIRITALDEKIIEKSRELGPVRIIRIDEPRSVTFPFGREVFDDRRTLYHGSRSTYCQDVEARGFIPSDRPFKEGPFKAISRALEAIGLPSDDSMCKALRISPPYAYKDLYLTPSFWGARGYATDGGGEVVRHAIATAEDFKRICASREGRSAHAEYLKAAISKEEERRRQQEEWWAQELEWKRDAYPADEIAREENEHARCRSQRHSLEPSWSAIATLEDDRAVEELLAIVENAREELSSLGGGGYPVVYAIRVEPEWFGDAWRSYIQNWASGSNSMELLCGHTIAVDRLIAKAEYPLGTDGKFTPDCTTWEQVLRLEAELS